MYSFPVAARKNDHKLGGLKRKFIPSQFWRLQVCKEGVSRSVLPLKDRGESPSFLFPASGLEWFFQVYFSRTLVFGLFALQAVSLCICLLVDVSNNSSCKKRTLAFNYVDLCSLQHKLLILLAYYRIITYDFRIYQIHFKILSSWSTNASETSVLTASTVLMNFNFFLYNYVISALYPSSLCC